MVKYKQSGFTIVELLIVVVVIAILAAITIVAYNGIQNRAVVSKLQSTTSQGLKKIESLKLTDPGNQYPADLVGTGLVAQGSATLTYFTQGGSSFCFQASEQNITYSVSSSSSQPSEVPCTQNGLLGWWRFNGNANDSIGNNNGTLVNGPTLTTGQNGQANGAYNFSAAGITTASGYTAGAITKTIWVRQTTYPNSFGTIFDFGTPTGSSPSAANSIYLETLGNGTAGVMAGARVESGGTSFGGYTNQLSNGLTLNQWYHIAQVVTPNVMQLYINGVQASSISGTYNFSPLQNAPTFGNGRATYAGVLDDARLYNRALSTAEILELYTAGAQ